MYDIIIIKYSDDKPNVIVLINDNIDFNTPLQAVSIKFLTTSIGKLKSKRDNEPINKTGNRTNDSWEKGRK